MAVSEKRCPSLHQADYWGIGLDLEPFILRPVQEKKHAPLVNGLRSVKYATLPGAFRSLKRTLTSGKRKRAGRDVSASDEDTVVPCASGEETADSHVNTVAPRISDEHVSPPPPTPPPKDPAPPPKEKGEEKPSPPP